ncbi:MAG TPA: sensor of ECF-type sigma factor [Flavobacterium sp.]|nr:sensor of ECF-type sigma factor [Flavobacterium sp.]
MKIRNIIPFVLLLISTMCFGQATNQKKAQLKALKVAFITEALSLSTDEAQKFWPIYNSFDNQQFEVRQKKMRSLQQRMNNGQIDSMSDKEAEAFLTQLESTEDELYQLRKKLNTNLRKVIDPLKIIKLKKAEEDFNKKLLRQYRNRKQK